MKTKLTYLLIGVLLALTFTFGALALRAQDATFSGPKWEYIWLHVDTPCAECKITKPVTVNGASATIDGTLFDVFNQMGGQGWEYIEQNGDFLLFKRPLI